MDNKGRISRRTMLGRIPATALATTAVLPIGAYLADAPSAMERLYFEWLPLRRAALAAYELEAPLVKAFDDWQSDRPDALRWRPATDITGFVKVPVPGVAGKCRLFVEHDEETIERLRRIVAGTERIEFGDPEKHQRRAKEILSALEGWEIDCERKRKEIGLADAEHAAEKAGDADYGMQDRILALPVDNVRDLAIRAAVARESGYSNADECEFLLDRLIELAGIEI